MVLGYHCEALDEKEGLQLFVDGFFADITVTVNCNASFDLNIAVFDENCDMHYELDMQIFSAITTLSYYKSVVNLLENKIVTNYRLVKQQDDDVSCTCIHNVGYCCDRFDFDFVNHVCEILSKNDIDVFCRYNEALLELISKDNDYKDNSNFKLDGDRMMSEQRNAMIFTDDIETALPTARFEDFIEANDIYIGINYAIFKNSQSDKIAVIDSKYIKQFIKIAEKYESLESSNIKYYSDFSHLVYVEIERLKFLEAVVRINEVSLISEYEFLSKQMHELKRIAPNIPIKTSYDFSFLSAEEFEMLCFDLLNSIGYLDVKCVGKTNAPDGGIDILADEEYRRLQKTERSKWIFQCKHSKKSLDRKEISEIDDLMKEHNAEGYGLFCSNSLTPAAVYRLENKKEQLGGNVLYYGKAEISVLIESHPKLAIKYRLI
ncbi:MAG: restriction endonuclease [Parabacteroides sp.]|nr:restriction endonuclease [Parabacteroides sp.]